MTTKVFSTVRRILDYRANAWRSLVVTDVTVVPIILYTVCDACPPADGLVALDGSTIVAAPASSEARYGGYMTYCGVNFGTNPLGLIVKNHTSLGDPGTDIVELGGRVVSLGVSNGRPDIQALHFQVGRSVTGYFSVTTSQGASEKRAWIAQPGRVIYCSNNNLSGYNLGDDGTGVVNDSEHPFRSVQTPTLLTFSVFGDIVQAGDQVILLPNIEGTEWNDDGFDNYFWRVRTNGFVSGSEADGNVGSGYIQLLGYPSTAVHTRVIAEAGKTGCFGGHPGSGDLGTGGIFITIANFFGTCPGGVDVKFGGPLNMASRADNWRVVNNLFGDWDAEWRFDELPAKQAGISGNSLSVFIAGNQCRNIGGGQENHGIYIDDGATASTMAYNWVHNVWGGNLIQLNANAGVADIHDWDIYGNLLGNGMRHGFNFANLVYDIRLWNNVVYNTAGASIRFAESPSGAGTRVFYNTFANFGLAGATQNYFGSGLMVDNTVSAPNTILIEDNIFQGSNQTTQYTWNNGVLTPGLTLRKNVYYGGSVGDTGSGNFTDSDPVFGNPLFTKTTSFITTQVVLAANDVPREQTAAIQAGGANVDLVIKAGSAAQNVGFSTAPTDDHSIFKARGFPPSRGAFEVLFP